jgi:hypothetical protein
MSSNNCKKAVLCLVIAAKLLLCLAIDVEGVAISNNCCKSCYYVSLLQ